MILIFIPFIFLEVNKKKIYTIDFFLCCY
jgi:hypothetical protein